MGEHKKSFWIIGIAIIVFLILLLGSLIGLKITRDKLGDVLENPNVLGEPQDASSVINYIELEDGSKENISKDIRDAEFDIEGVKVSGFSIIEKEGSSTISASIENTTEETVSGKTLLISLYDANEELIKEFTMDIAELAAQAPTITIRTLNMDCANAATIDVKVAGAVEDVSGEAIVSGEVQE